MADKATAAGTAHLGLGDVIRRAFKSTLQAMEKMPLLFISTYAAIVAVSFAGQYLGQPVDASAALMTGLGSVSAGLVGIGRAFLLYVVNTIVLAPVAVATHRFVLRDAATRSITWPMAGHTCVFIFWLALIEALSMLCLVPSAIGAPGAAGRRVLMVMTYIAAFAVAALGIRLSMLFPAIAVGTPSGSFLGRAVTSWRQTRGHVGDIFAIGFFIVLAVSFPIGFAVEFFTVEGLVAQKIAAAQHLDPHAFMILFTEGPVTFLYGLQYVVLTASGAAGLSWIYRNLVEHSADGANKAG